MGGSCFGNCFLFTVVGGIGLWPCLVYSQRNAVRRQYEVTKDESTCCISCFCPLCSLCQTAKETGMYGQGEQLIEDGLKEESNGLVKGEIVRQ